MKGKGPDSVKDVYIPVDAQFKNSEYRIQVIGTSKGSSFAVPFAYTFSGRETAASLSLSLQRSDYIKGHQRRRGAEAEDQQGAAGYLSDELTVECGKCGVLPDASWPHLGFHIFWAPFPYSTATPHLWQEGVTHDLHMRNS